jgi:FimV-like protein
MQLFPRTLISLALVAASWSAAAVEPAVADLRASDTAQPLGRSITGKDTLWQIAGQVIRDAGTGVSRNQAMVAILRRNPAAFQHGNLHRLNKGADLVIPTLAEIRAEDAAKAAALIENHQAVLADKSLKPLEPEPLGTVVSVAPKPETRPAPAPASAPEVKPAPLIKPVVPAPAPAPAPAVIPASAPEVKPVAASAATPAPVAVAASAAASSAASAVVAATEASAPTDPKNGNGLLWAIGLTMVGVAAGGLVYFLRRAPTDRQMAEVAAATEAAASKRAGLRQQLSISTAALDIAKKVEEQAQTIWMVQRGEEPAPAGADLRAEVPMRLALARAYLELKDRDQSRRQLEIVLRDGDEIQREEAQGAIARL